MPGGRGGRRQGKVGRAYGNRSDLNGLAPAAATGQAYGQAKTQLDQQRALPMSAPAVPAPPAAAGQAAPMFPPAGSLGRLDRPTERTAEPLTAGAPFGPGPGPAGLGMSSPSTLADLVGQVAASPNATTDVQRLAAFLASGQL